MILNKVTNALMIGARSLALAGTASAQMPEEKLAELGYPQINDGKPKPFGNYVNGNVTGGLLYVSSAAPKGVNAVQE